MSQRVPADCTILVVDDDPDVTTFLASVLMDGGFKVTVANSGLAALERLREGLPDLISLDLVMPGHSGIRVLHDLRKRPEWSRIPVMVVSGHAREPEVRTGLDDVLADSTISGPSLYLEKPVTPQSYLDAVRHVLGITSGAEAGATERVSELRAELASLLEGADAGSIEAAIHAMRTSGRADR
ncbi:MAG: response regulator [Acidobacteriota bacterium]